MKKKILVGRAFFDGDSAALRVVDRLRIALVGASAASATATTLVAVDGGSGRIEDVAVGGAIAVVHGADEASAGTAAALLAAATRAEAAALALEAAAAVAGLVRVRTAETAAAVIGWLGLSARSTEAAALAEACAAARVLARAGTIAVAELLFPLLGAAGGVGCVLAAVLAGTVLGAAVLAEAASLSAIVAAEITIALRRGGCRRNSGLRFSAGGCRGAGLHGPDHFARHGGDAVGCLGSTIDTVRLAFTLAPPTPAAFGLAHAVRNPLAVFIQFVPVAAAEVALRRTLRNVRGRFRQTLLCTHASASSYVLLCRFGCPES